MKKTNIAFMCLLALSISQPTATIGYKSLIVGALVATSAQAQQPTPTPTFVPFGVNQTYPTPAPTEAPATSMSSRASRNCCPACGRRPEDQTPTIARSARILAQMAVEQQGKN